MGFTENFDRDTGFTAQGIELIRRFHPVATSPEVNIGAQSERINKGEKKVFGHFGKIVALPDGDLIAVHNEQATGSHYWDDTNKPLCRHSSDGGYTWTLGVDIFNDFRDQITKDAPLMRTCYGALIVLNDGTIWLGPVRTDDGQWRIPRSTDRGQSWDLDLTCPSHSHYWCQTHNGRIVGSGNDDKTYGLNVRSILLTDKDASQWQVVEVGPHSGYQSDERCLVETDKPGEMYHLMRNQCESHYFTNAWSSDYGKTWHDYGPSGLWFSMRPSRPFVILAEQGLLLAVHAERSNGRIVVTASFDGGRTWDLGRRIFVLDDPNENLMGSHGYCSMAKSGPDSWFVTWYGNPQSFYGSNVEISYITHPYEGLRLSAEADVDDQRLIARWSFEGHQRNIIEGHPSCDYGKAHLVGRRDGKIGQCASFNGTTSYVEIRDTPTMRVPAYFSVECFFRAEELAGDQALISKRPYYHLGLSDNRVTFQLGPPVATDQSPQLAVASETVIRADRWYHVVATVGVSGFNYNTAALYLDGVQVGHVRLSDAGIGAGGWSYARTAAYIDQRPEKGPTFMPYGEFEGYHARSSYHMYLGMDNVTRQSPFKGQLDEVSLYGRDLLPTEIRDLSRRGYGTNSPGIVTTDPIDLDAPSWGTFQADMSTPPGTAMTFDVLDGSQDKVLRRDVKVDETLDAITAQGIRLRATLKTTNPQVTPVLRSMALTGSIDS